MKNWLKQTQKLKAILVSLTIAVLAIVALYVSAETFGFSWPTESTIEQKKNELKQQRRALKELQTRKKELDSQDQQLNDLCTKFWKVEDGKRPDTVMRGKIEQLAKQADLSLQSMSDIRKSKIVKGFYTLEMNISSNASIEQTADFLLELKRVKPCFYWQQINMRPDNIRNATKVNLTGTLKIICQEQENESETETTAKVEEKK